MAVRLASLVVIGPAGSGRSTALETWVEAAERARRTSPRLVEAAIVPVDAAGIEHWHRNTETDVALAIDDAELLDDEVLGVITSLASGRVVALTTGIGPRSVALDRLIDRLADGTAAADPAEVQRTAPLTSDDVVELFAAAPQSTEQIDALVRQTAGNAALLAAAVRAGWDGDVSVVPPDLADAVLRRIRRLPAAATEVLRLVAIGCSFADGVGLIGGTSQVDVERDLAMSGLVDERQGDRRVAPLAITALADDTTDAEIATLADRVLSDVGALGLGALQLAMLQLHASSSSALDRAAAAVRLGRPDAAAVVAALPDLGHPAAAQVAFAEDIRQLRLDRAVTRRLGTGLGGALSAVALTIAGMPPPAVATPPVGGGHEERWWALDRTLRAFIDGDQAEAVAGALHAHDDAIRADDTTLAGITPSTIAALVLLQSGEVARAREVAADALHVGAGGPGERRTHALVHALASVQLGDFSIALDLARTTEPGGPWDTTGREALLTAAIDAVIARRSGDTARLREAWQAARPLLDRSLETWLLADQLTDLAATGVRVGDEPAARGLFDRLSGQLATFPDSGPGPTMRMWGAVQLDIAGERWDAVASVPDPWRDGLPSGDRPRARVLARRAWAGVAASRLGSGSAANDQIRDAADALTAVGDAWDASRLLGQAALDEPDAQRARELLEAARALVTEPVETTDQLVSAGLSEREAEVSRLVVEGHTYKEIGAQLYISPKTVEHHVAKIRQRLGAGSRAELLAAIRELIDR